MRAAALNVRSDGIETLFCSPRFSVPYTKSSCGFTYPRHNIMLWMIRTVARRQLARAREPRLPPTLGAKATRQLTRGCQPAVPPSKLSASRGQTGWHASRCSRAARATRAGDGAAAAAAGGAGVFQQLDFWERDAALPAKDVVLALAAAFANGRRRHRSGSHRLIVRVLDRAARPRRCARRARRRYDAQA